MAAIRRASITENVCEFEYLSESQPKEPVNITTEVRLFLELAIPTTLLNLGWTVSPFMTASFVGLRFGKVYLSAFTLANLTTNLTTSSLLSGLFSASDTLAPQAFGKNDYAEVGLIAIRGVFASVLLLVPINIFLVFNMENILVAAGQDPEASKYATQWYRIFVLALPCLILYNAAWKFLSAQHVMRPMILVSLFSCVVTLPIALEIFTRIWGFLGSAVAYVFFQASQASLLLLYLDRKKPHVDGTWPGFGNWRRALKYEPTMEYISLGAGGMLAQSEWIFWEAVGLIIGNLGVVALSVHTIPSQIIMAASMAPFAVGTALAIRMGVNMSQSVARAKRIALVTVLVSAVLFGLLSIAIYFASGLLFSIFTRDEEVKSVAQSIWWKVCCYSFSIAIFAINCGIATGLGIQWTLGYVNFFFLWILCIPVMYYYVLVRDGGLQAAWTSLNVPYICMNTVLLVIMFVFTDWQKVKDRIDERGVSEPSMELEAQQQQQQQHHDDKGLSSETQGLLKSAEQSSYGGRA